MLTDCSTESCLLSFKSQQQCHPLREDITDHPWVKLPQSLSISLPCLPSSLNVSFFESVLIISMLTSLFLLHPLQMIVSIRAGTLYVYFSASHPQNLDDCLAFSSCSIIFLNKCATRNLRIKAISILASKMASLALAAQKKEVETPCTSQKIHMYQWALFIN